MGSARPNRGGSSTACSWVIYGLDQFGENTWEFCWKPVLRSFGASRVQDLGLGRGPGISLHSLNCI